MARIIAFFGRQPKSVLLTLAFTLIAVIGVLDYATGPEIASSAFYLIPIFLATWFADRPSGLLVSLVSALVWLIADWVPRQSYPHPLIPFWNTAVRLAMFLIVTYTLSALRSLQKQQEELIHFIVHDLRSPLTSILVGLKALQRAGHATLDANQRTLVETAIGSGDRMVTLINSILDLSRLDHGEMPLRIQDIDVGELVGASVEQVTLLAAQKHVAIMPEVEADAATIRADADLTLRVLINLLVNALKFSPADSTIRLRVARDGQYTTTFSIRDQGPGIPRGWAKKVFDKYKQIEARKHGVAVGSGLGLTFCQQAVIAQGGRIWLESGVGKGTTICFTLPPGAGQGRERAAAIPSDQ